MLYLLDANVLIDANRDFYAIDRVTEFWEWLAFMGAKRSIKIPVEMFDEIKQGNDRLSEWAKKKENQDSLQLNEDVNEDLVRRVIAEGYAPDLTDTEFEQVGKDPFLIAYALVEPAGRCVVTTETSKPKKQRANRHIPDVCASLGINSCHAYELFRILDFRTDWKTRY